MSWELINIFLVFIPSCLFWWNKKKTLFVPSCHKFPILVLITRRTKNEAVGFYPVSCHAKHGTMIFVLSYHVHSHIYNSHIYKTPHKVWKLGRIWMVIFAFSSVVTYNQLLLIVYKILSTQSQNRLWYLLKKTLHGIFL